MAGSLQRVRFSISSPFLSNFLPGNDKKERLCSSFWYQNSMTKQIWMDTALAALLLLRTTDEIHSYHVNILTCRIKAMRELVTKHVTNGAITQRPEMKEHLIHKNSRNAACVRDRSLDPVKSKNGWLNDHHSVQQSKSETGRNFFEEGLRNSRKNIPTQQKQRARDHGKKIEQELSTI